MNFIQSLVEDNIHQLQEIINILQKITTTLYTNNKTPYFDSGVGQHVRHVIDHYYCFFRGLRDGLSISYDQRERNPDVEENREFAIQLLQKIIYQLQKINLSQSTPLRVKSNNHDDIDSTQSWSKSSFERELQYLLSHTVHHNAILAIILKLQNHVIEKQFGMAPSTIQHQKKK
ncbi:MAG: hypothetical protein ACI86H_001117 [bacterium]|jgi:hypothetical protein